MAQRRFWNWKDDDLTIDISQWLIGLINSGRFRGFDPVLGSTMDLVLNHQTTGAIRVDKQGDFTPRYGVLSTKQGIITQEYDNITLAIPATPNGFYRKALVVFSHEYVEVVGGEEGLYSLVLGPETAVGTQADFPALINEATQTILGYLTLPENCTALNQVGVIYTQAAIPSFANQLDFIEKSNGFFVTNLDARGNKIIRLQTCTEPDDAANKFYVDKAIAENIVSATESQRGIAELADTAEAEAGTDDMRIITPFKWLKAFIKNLATQAETNDDTIDNKAITPKTLSNRIALETRKGVAAIATEAEAKLGEDDTTIITPFKLKRAMPLIPITIEIGVWNIEANEDITIPHGLGADWDKVVAMDLTIRDDANSIIVTPSIQANKFRITNMDCELILDVSSGLVLSDMNATSMNRGYITFWVKKDVPNFTGLLSVNAGVDKLSMTNFLFQQDTALRKIKIINTYSTGMPKVQVELDEGVGNYAGTFKLMYKTVAAVDWQIVTSPIVDGEVVPLSLIWSGTSMMFKLQFKRVNSGLVAETNTITANTTVINSEFVDTGFVPTSSEHTVALAGFIESIGSALTSSSWTVETAPVGASYDFVDPTSPTSGFIVRTFGEYVLKLAAINAAALTANDTVVITVSENINQPPVINAITIPAYAISDDTYADVSGLAPLDGWYQTSGSIAASDPNGDLLVLSIVEVDNYNHITGAIGSPVIGSDLEFSFVGAQFTIRRMNTAASTSSDRSRFYFFKAVADDGHGGIAEKGFRIKVVPVDVVAMPIISFSPNESVLLQYAGNTLINSSSISSIASLKVTVGAFRGIGLSAVGRLVIGNSTFLSGTHTITSLMSASMPTSLVVASNGGNPSGEGTAYATFRAYNSVGTLLAEATVEAQIP